MRSRLNTYSYRSRKCLIDDSLCVLFYPDDSVRLEMTGFVQAVSVKVMNFAWRRPRERWEHQDLHINRISVSLSDLDPHDLFPVSLSTQGHILFSAHSQMDVTKQFCWEYFSITSIKFIDKLWNTSILLKEYYLWIFSNWCLQYVPYLWHGYIDKIFACQFV